jgi:omega-6 fatty acid desaturase (delta-12 desaturase)
MNVNHIQSTSTDRSWENVIMRYNRPDLRKSIWQILNTLIPYAGSWYLMILSLQYPYWITLLLSLPAAGLLVRAFIIFHDCGHGSFFRTRKANEILGRIIGVLVFTPYSPWHQSHRVHHATSGNLDKRGVGDVWTLTLEEYKARSKWDQFLYRMYRNPFVMFVLGPVYMVLFRNRITTKRMSRQDRLDVYTTNLGLFLTASVLSLLIGVKAYLLIQVPIIMIAHFLGIWLFYVQHQYDEVSWERGQQWDYKTAALSGSSFLKLPSVLQWFTGNIGFHHVHHLSSKIPNYHLARCHYENDLFTTVKPITLLSSFKSLRLRLWDETTRQMISFRKMTVFYR